MILLQMHRDLAREAVRTSLVLLKNGKDPMEPFLPLERNAKRILVAGTHTDDLGNQCGGWTATKYGSSGRITIGMELCCYFSTIFMTESLIVDYHNQCDICLCVYIYLNKIRISLACIMFYQTISFFKF